MKNMEDDTMKPEFEALSRIAKEKHKNRIAKNPDRIKYAIEQFNKNNIEYILKNQNIGHFHIKTKTNKLIQFWAGTGKIIGTEKRGIYNLIKIVKGSE